MIDFPERGGKVISWLPAAHIAERGAHYYLPVTKRPHGHDLPGPAQDHRVPAEGAARPGSSPCRGSGRSSRPGSRRCSPSLPDEQREAGAEGARGGARRRSALEQAGEEVPDGARRGRRARPTSRCSPSCAQQLGLDEALAVNVGAAPTPLEVLEFFHAIGIPIGELWGMSETCGARHRQPARPDQARHGRPAGARGRDQARRGRRGAGQGRLRDARLPQPAREDRRDVRPTTAGCAPATSASSTRTAT